MECIIEDTILTLESELFCAYFDFFKCSLFENNYIKSTCSVCLLVQISDIFERLGMGLKWRVWNPNQFRFRTFTAFQSFEVPFIIFWFKANKTYPSLFEWLSWLTSSVECFTWLLESGLVSLASVCDQGQLLTAHDFFVSRLLEKSVSKHETTFGKSWCTDEVW